MNRIDVEEQVRLAMLGAGIEITETPVGDGKLHQLIRGIGVQIGFPCIHGAWLSGVSTYGTKLAI